MQQKLIDYRDTLARIKAEWDKAEAAIKISEQVGLQVVFPAIKELRYAGRRIADALHQMSISGDPKDIQALLDDALFDCFRARHDAIDATISTVAAEMEIVIRKLGPDCVIKAFPDYLKMLEALHEAQEKVSSSRGRKQDREIVYAAIEAVDLPAIVALYRKFKRSEPLMLQLAKEARRWPFIGLAATIITCAIGIIVSIILALW